MVGKIWIYVMGGSGKLFRQVGRDYPLHARSSDSDQKGTKKHIDKIRRQKIKQNNHNTHDYTECRNTATTDNSFEDTSPKHGTKNATNIQHNREPKRLNLNYIDKVDQIPK